jgi:16S rRNA (guanine527-N7)-methyltransferase
MPQILYKGAQQFNLSLTEAQLRAFELYSQELIAWNQSINLTRIVEPREIAVKHFLDSLSVCLALPDLSLPFFMIDVGSGAGFPGLPLKIARPGIELTLVESTAKKTAFLRHMVDVLNLTGVTVLTARAEEAGRRPNHRQRYDVAAARAVAPLPVLAEYTLPLVKVGGRVIIQKGKNPTAELKDAAKALEILGGQVKQILPVSVPGLEAARHLLIIQKDKATPEQYPRRPGRPAKRPL